MAPRLCPSASLLAILATASLHAQSEPKLSFNLFGDIRAVGRDTQGHARGNLGQFDFMVHGTLGDRWSAFAEAVLEWNPDSGGTGVDLERFYVQYTITDALYFGLGKRHIPMGYWNNAYHHGAYFQPTIDRPQLVAFEDGGGIQPAHDTGVWVEGRNLGAAKFGYSVMASNGQTGNQENDANNHKALTAHAEFRPLPSFPLVLGGTFRSDTLSPNSPLNSRSGTVPLATDLTFAGGDLRIDHGRFLFISEFISLKEKDAVGEATDRAWFAYLGLPLEEWTPYALYQDTTIDLGTRLFANGFVLSQKGSTLGLKYDWGGSINAKVEVSETTLKDAPKTKDHKIQLAVAFAF